MSSWELDTNADALYVTLTPASVARQVVITDDLVVDVDVGGKPVGVEVLSVSRSWDPRPVFERFELAPMDVALLTALALRPITIRLASVVAEALPAVRQVSTEARGSLRPAPLVEVG